MKNLLVLWSILFTFHAWGQECQTASKCKSQLIRLNVDNNALTQIVSSSTRLQEATLPSVDGFLNSDIFKKSFVREYPMEPMGFPYNSALCISEKQQGDPNFKDIDCSNPLLCSDENINQQARSEICFNLPCGLVMGSHMSQCPASGGSALPTMIEFPHPVELRKLDLKTKSVSLENNSLRGCFTVESLEVSTSVAVQFAQDSGVNYEELGLNNVLIQLDGTREICMSAVIDFNASPSVSQIQISRENGDFVSDGMITRGLSSATVVGLSGYSPAALNILKTTALPPLVRHFRPSMETAIQNALASTFEEQVSGWMQQFGNSSGPTTIDAPANSLASELGISNMSMRKYVDLMDCSLKQREGESIPSDHRCLNQLYPFRDSNLRVRDIPAPDRVANLISEQIGRYDQVTSESIRSELAGFEQRMSALGLQSLYTSKISPVVSKIARNQTNSQFINGIELVTRLGNGSVDSGVSVAIPEICDAVNPSPHSGRAIAGCPVQAYVDLNEMNRLFTTMYQSGRLCHSGRGDFVPETDRSGNVSRNRDGSPRGSGCLFVIEESDDGMRCYLNGAPQIRFDSASSGYKVQLNTKECYRGDVALGQGKIGGDINFEISFTPTICGGGDFCLENGSAEWNVTPGTARYALRERSFFNGIVRKTIDKKLNAIVGETIRLPLAGGSGPLSSLPLVPDGRVDRGDGFFGACMRPR